MKNHKLDFFQEHIYYTLNDFHATCPTTTHKYNMSLDLMVSRQDVSTVNLRVPSWIPKKNLLHTTGVFPSEPKQVYLSIQTHATSCSLMQVASFHTHRHLRKNLYYISGPIINFNILRPSKAYFGFQNLSSDFFFKGMHSMQDHQEMLSSKTKHRSHKSCDEIFSNLIMNKTDLSKKYAKSHLFG